MSSSRHRFGVRIEPGSQVRLDDIPTDDKGGFDGRDDPAAQKQLDGDLARLAELQEKLFAEATRGVLRRVVGPLDSRGLDVVGFSTPTRDDLAHDYLWRVHQHTPRRGHITFFNRSHYEEVLIARVMKLVPQTTWERRYRHINEFERMLVEEGTAVVKLFLHISKAEQKRRLEERLTDPAKRWKFDPADLEARARWDDYRAAYNEALSRCSTEWAPSWVVPADHKWYRDLTVARILVDVLEQLDPRVPPPKGDLSKIVIPD